MSDIEYIIKSIELTDVEKYGKDKYNSNNHWTDETTTYNYEYVLQQTSTEKWIDLFKQYKKITIDNQVWISWLKQTSIISSKTGKFSKCFEDEFDIMVEELNKQYSYLFNSVEPGYFVRVNNVSLKYGQHKEGPYNNIRTILESVVSCIRGHTPIKQNTKLLNIYLIDWIEIKPEFEFRVFVYNNKITAISQQNIYSLLFTEYLDIYKESFNTFIIQILNNIVKYFYEEMLPKITWISNYTFDIAITKSKPYFIELNSFGKEQAAGSALFHWLLDEKILYNDSTNTIEFRYTI